MSDERGRVKHVPPSNVIGRLRFTRPLGFWWGDAFADTWNPSTKKLHALQLELIENIALA
ncbi:MAG: hypothetical protein ACSHX8_09515 [Opitutaceae bacterium]